MTRNCTHHSLLTGISLPLVARGHEPEQAQTARKRGTVCDDSPFTVNRSAERVTTGAASGRVGVVDRESLLLNGVFEVDAGTVEVRHAHLVDHNLNPVEVDS